MPTLLTSPPGQSLIDIEPTFLPIGHMRQISRVTRLDGPNIEGEVDLGPGHWVFPEHFPLDPIFPGSLTIEAAGQLVALWAWGNGGTGRPRLVRAVAEFKCPAGPSTDRLTLIAEVKRKRHLHFSAVQVWAGEAHIAIADVVLAILPAESPAAICYT